MYVQPIDLVNGLAVGLWEAIDKWAAIPATPETLEARVAAAAEVETVIMDAFKIRNLINARMGLDMLAHRLREGGPETSREDIRARVSQCAEWINEIVPRSPLR